MNKLLAFEVSIEAQYGPFHYEPPPGAGKPMVPGQLTLVLGRGQRILGFEVIDEPPTGCEWIIRLMGEHCFASVTDIALFDERFSDADVPLLLAFRDVKVINVSDTAITDKGLAQLATLKHLVRLDVSGTKVTAKSLRLLANCRELKELDICDTDADEKTIDYLKEALPGCWIR